jgi:hypothetical protein
MGTEVTPARSNIYVEDVQYKSSISEAVGTKIAGAINMVNHNQYDEKIWMLNGLYSSEAAGGLDGAYICARDMEIIGVAMYNLVAGSSGTLELNIIRHTSSGVSGSSIFSTTPKLTTASGNNAFLFYDFSNSIAVENPSGATQPVLVSVNLDKGDMLTMNKVQGQVNGESCGIMIQMRPR